MKYGFIGCGNMGGAIARSLARSTNDILLSDPSEKAQLLANELSCQCADNVAVAEQCDRIFLAVKPQVMPNALAPIAPILAQRKPLIITMAAGLKMERIEEYIGASVPIIRIMPNTPVAIGKGMILYSCNPLVTESDVKTFLDDMRYAGRLDRLNEELIDVASALSGSGPAYMYQFLEAMTDGAVACGLPREKAIVYAAATMEGAAQMLIQTGADPSKLRDAVCSPGGSTIEGLKALNQKDFCGTVVDCIMAAYKRNLELGQ